MIIFGNMVLTIIGLLLNLILLVSLLFLNAYFKKKGENLAQHEDIEKLTRRVEEVRSTFLREQESLKANLAVNNDIKIRLYEERKLACFQHYSIVNELIHRYVTFPGTENAKVTKEMIELGLESHSSAMKQLYLVVGKLRLLIDDEATTTDIREASVALLGIAGTYEEAFRAISKEISKNGTREEECTAIISSYEEKILKKVNEFDVYDGRLKASLKKTLIQGIQ